MGEYLSTALYLESKYNARGCTVDDEDEKVLYGM